MAKIDHKTDIVHISCFKHSYEDGTEIDICDTHFCAKPGEIVIITGPNGSGKSTLLNHIVGLLSPTKGVVRVMGIDVTTKEFEDIRKEIGAVFQDVDEQLIAPTVLEDVAFSPLNYGYKDKTAEDMALEMLKELKITQLKNKVPHYLSGGEKKKVALAGALVMQPKLLILDEVFANMDSSSKEEIADLLILLNRKKGMTIIMTSHEDEVIKKLNARIYQIGKHEKKA
jgi:cobalt/nickel transport system ATP-binding protein